LVSLVVLVLSAALGYMLAVADIQITDTGPWQLHESYQGIYVQAVADAYAADGDVANAIDRLSFLCQQNNGLEGAFQQAQARYGNNPEKLANLDQLRTLVSSGQVQQNSGVQVCSTQALNALPVPGIVPLAALILMGVILVGAGVMQMIRASEEGIVPSAAAPGAAPSVGERARPTLPGLGRKKPEEAADTLRSAAARGAAISATVERTDFQATGMEPPLVQFMTTYLRGDDLYDDSFSIETQGGEFLGETGVGISEVISTTDSKNVTAFEVWLFDKNDIRTVTKVLMSDHAFNDDAIRAKLAPKGEAVRAESGLRVVLETASLRVQARIVDVSYSTSAMPPNGVFERITLELAAWKREGQAGGGPPPMATPSRVNLPGSTPPTGSPPLSG